MLYYIKIIKAEMGPKDGQGIANTIDPGKSYHRNLSHGGPLRWNSKQACNNPFECVSYNGHLAVLGKNTVMTNTNRQSNWTENSRRARAPQRYSTCSKAILRVTSQEFLEVFMAGQRSLLTYLPRRNRLRPNPDDYFSW